MKTFDKDKILFNGAVIDIVISNFNASCGDDSSEPFLEKLYDEYQSENSLKNVKAWLKKRLIGEFKYLEAPPEWVEDEPEWQFHNGKPMVFVMQKKISEKSKDILGWGYVIYVFAAKEEVDDGWEVITKVVTQDFV